MKKWPILILILFAACAHNPFGDPGYGDGDARFSVYFNDPGTNRLTGIDKGIDNEIVKLIDEAEESVYAAFYNLGRDSIIDALIRAEQRQLDVKAVGDIDEFFTDGYQKLAATTIDFALGNSSGIQHNKFIIVDKKYVVTGTGNFTDNGFIRNNNNFFIIESKALAEHYLNEFNQMHRGLFASKKRPRGDIGSFTINGFNVQVYFSPYEGDQAMDKLIELINNATDNVHYMIFAHTHDELASAMIRAANRGLVVRGVHDSTFVTGTSEEAPRLYSSGFDNNGNRLANYVDNRYDGNEHTKYEGNPAHGGKLHCKTLIVDAGTDHAILATGSFNWSNNAINNNDENLLVVYDADVANTIYEQWQQVWAISNPISNKVSTVYGDTASKGDIVISEVGWAGSATNSGSIDSDDDFIEIYNPTSKTIDLSHWVLQWGTNDNKNHYPIPDKYNDYYETDNTIAPGYHRIFYNVTKGAYARASGTTSQEFKISGTKEFDLVASDFKIKLYDKTMNLIDEVGDGTLPPAGYLDSFNDKVYSMNRRNYTSSPLDGTSVAAWYSSTALCNTSKNSSCSGFDSNTYGTPGYKNEAETAPLLLRAEWQSSTQLKLIFNSQMSNCVTYTPTPDLSVNTEQGSSTLNISSTNGISTTSDIATLLVTFTAPSTSGDVYSITPSNTNCKDMNNTAAAGNKLTFSAYNSTLAQVELTEVAMKQSSSSTPPADFIILKAKTSGSVRGLEIYEYNYAGKNLLYKLNDLVVNANDQIVINLKNSTTYAAYSEDIAYNTTAPAGSNSTYGTPYCMYSTDDGLDGTDDIIIVQYPDGNIQDVVYYSDQDGSVSESLMKGGLRYVYENLQNYWPLSEKPIDEYNDYTIQLQGANVSNVDSNNSIVKSGGSWQYSSSVTNPQCI